MYLDEMLLLGALGTEGLRERKIKCAVLTSEPPERGMPFRTVRHLQVETTGYPDGGAPVDMSLSGQAAANPGEADQAAVILIGPAMFRNLHGEWPEGTVIAYYFADSSSKNLLWHIPIGKAISLDGDVTIPSVVLH